MPAGVLSFPEILLFINIYGSFHLGSEFWKTFPPQHIKIAGGETRTHDPHGTGLPDHVRNNSLWELDLSKLPFLGVVRPSFFRKKG
jgi:hypothetical protein